MTTGHLILADSRKAYPVAVRASGVWVYDAEGKPFLDAIGGIHVVTIGHGVAEIGAAMAAQASTIAFTGDRWFVTEAALRLAEELTRVAPPGFNQVYLSTGGSEANEMAYQAALSYHRAKGRLARTKMIFRYPSYHGGTIATISMSGHDGHQSRIGAALLGFASIPYPDCSECPFALRYPSCDVRCADALAESIESNNPETIAGFIFEPIVGTTGGAISAPPGYYERCRAICDRFDVVMIADEVITGLGRTGVPFASRDGAIPDLITTSKALASGYSPIAATLINDRVWSVIVDTAAEPMALRLTNAAHPVSAAAALAVQEFVSSHQLISRCGRQGDHLRSALSEMIGRSPFLCVVRGEGLLVGIELRDRLSGRPFARNRRVHERILTAANGLGLLLAGGSGGPGGFNRDHIVLTPPYTITDSEIEILVQLLESSMLVAFESLAA